MSDLIERLTKASSRLKGITDATPEIYSVPPGTRLAVERDDVLMAQYRLDEAAVEIDSLLIRVGRAEADRNVVDEAAESFLRRLIAAEARVNDLEAALRPFAEGSLDVSHTAVILGYHAAELAIAAARAALPATEAK